jgi:sugar transferase (PEP-CTERM/EpsH1 system associated)
VDCVTFYDKPGDRKYIADLESICNSVKAFFLHKWISLTLGGLWFLLGRSISVGCFYNYRVAKTINNLLDHRQYKFVICYSSQIAFYAKKSKVSKIIDFVDVDSDKWKQYALHKKFPMNWLYTTEAKRLARYEDDIWSSFALSFLSTERERELFCANRSGLKVHSFGNGVDHSYFTPISCKREKICIFTGAMDYFPNIDAVVWFVKSILPSVVNVIPDVQFYIVGSHPDPEVQKLAGPNVVVTGFVDDIRTYIARATLAVYPLRIARGIQNKILEAMSMGIPTIIPESLKTSIEGDWPEGVNIFKDEKECSAMIIDALKHFSSEALPSTTLRNYIVENRDWETRLGKFHETILEQFRSV